MKRTFALLLAAMSPFSCGGEKPASTTRSKTESKPPSDAKEPASASTSPAGEAATVWTTRCGTCHGVTGIGDGPAAAALNPKPRSFADPSWQDSTDDARIKKVMIEGGASVGLSPLMVPNPDLRDKPLLVEELVKSIRALKK